MGDPVLSSSLTTLATQILHLEHMNQTRNAQSEAAQMREEMREMTTKLHQAHSEKLTLEQTLLIKVNNSSTEQLSAHADDLEKNLTLIRNISKYRPESTKHLELINTPLLEKLGQDQKVAVLSEHLKSSCQKLDEALEKIENEKRRRLQLE